MGKGYTIEQAGVGWRGTPLDRTHLRGHKLSVVEGLCVANPMLVGSDFVNSNEGNNRSIIWYDKHVLEAGIGAEKIGDGIRTKFDDRKMRIDAASFVEGTISLGFGHTHYGEFKWQMNNVDTVKVLKKRGLEEFGDPYAYIPRAPGVSGVLISSDGEAIVGIRQTENNDDFEGKIQTVAGHLPYQEDPRDVDLRAGLLHEVREETGVASDQIERVSLIGLFSDPAYAGADIDFGFVVQTDMPSRYFTSGEWRDSVGPAQREHRSFHAISYNGVQALLTGGRLPDNQKREVIGATRGILSQLTQADFN